MISLAFLTLAFAPNELEGTWRAEAAGPYRDVTVTLKIEGDRFELKSLRNDGRIVEVKGSLVVDAKAAPKAIDFKGAQATGEGRTVPLPDRLGVYAVEGDVFTLRAAERRPVLLNGPDVEVDPGYLKLKRVVTKAP